jgi:hypothetical protein
MQLIALFVTLALLLGLQTTDPRNQPPIANDDDVFLLYHPARIVDIPVLDNDVDPEGQVLRITRLALTEGGKAEIVDGQAVRVQIDWSAQTGGLPYGLVARGVYVVGDGLAESKAQWFVWYWPEILP